MKIRITAILLALLMLTSCATVPPVEETVKQPEETVQVEEQVTEPEVEEKVEPAEPEPTEPIVSEPLPVSESEDEEEAHSELYESVKYSRTVYIAPTGKRYHYRSTCAGKNAMGLSLDEVDHYYTPCLKCVHD